MTDSDNSVLERQEQKSLPHYGVKDLFFVTSVCAVLLFCASRVGWDNPIFWTVTVFTIAFMAIFSWALNKTKSRAFAFIVCLLAFVCPLFMMMFLSVAMLMNSVFHIGVILWTHRVPGYTRKQVVFASLLCTSVSFFLATLMGESAGNQIASERKNYPFISTQERLTFEKGFEWSVSAPVNEDSELILELEEKAGYEQFSGRVRSLNLIHSRHVENFARAQGFGVGRMMMGPGKMDDWIEPSDIPFDKTLIPFDKTTLPTILQIPRLDLLDAGDDHTEVHQISIHDFFNFQSFGFVRPDGSAAGFIPHVFHRHPLWDSETELDFDLEQLQLVSLRRFDEPRAYVLDHLPRMDQLSSKNAKTRPLNAFEFGALKKLRSNEEVVSQEELESIQMMGAIRAADHCLNCHNAQRGELIGAFSYLFRKKTIAKPPNEVVEAFD